MEIKYTYNKTPIGWVWQLEIDGYKFFLSVRGFKSIKKICQRKFEYFDP